jgi:hypothetical protein
MKVQLDSKAALFAARIKRLNARHPVKRRVDRATSSAYRYNTRLKRQARRAGPTEPIDPLAIPPWEMRARGDTQIGYRPELSKEQTAASFRAWV